MVYRVQIHPTAIEETEVAYLWISERAPAAAVRWFNDLLAAVSSLENQPERCAIAPESAEFDVEIRQLLYGRKPAGVYRILYTVTDDEVRVLHVRHAARQHLKAEEESGQ